MDTGLSCRGAGPYEYSSNVATSIGDLMHGIPGRTHPIPPGSRIKSGMTTQASGMTIEALGGCVGGSDETGSSPWIIVCRYFRVDFRHDNYLCIAATARNLVRIPKRRTTQ